MLPETIKKAVIDVARILRDNPGLFVVIEGYADQIGTQRYNMILSKKRARKIAAILEESGIPVEKIGSVVWFGKRQLKCFRLDESCRKFNRRVVIRFRTKPGYE